MTESNSGSIPGSLRILLAGESWFEYSMHMKGVAGHTAAGYGEGHEPLTRCLSEAGHEVVHCPAHRAPIDFPATAEALEEYDLVILSDISADSLLLSPDVVERGLRGPNRLRAVTEWTAAGGALLMIGGYLSFSGFAGNANYGLTPVADALPVRLLDRDDRIEVPEGVDPVVVAEHPVTAGLPEQWPYLLGYNRLIPKEGARTLVAVGEDPLLVVDDFDRGRVAAFASDCSPHWAPPAFVEWELYGRLWNQLAGWLTGSPEAGYDAGDMTSHEEEIAR